LFVAKSLGWFLELKTAFFAGFWGKALAEGGTLRGKTW
jgi:hypothetical protein